jgi:predicted nucleic acid-binding protein
MKFMIANVFVDTNVLVYARDSTEPMKQSIASDVIARLWHDQSGCISMQVLNEYYVTVTRKLKPGLPQDEAWEDVQGLFAWQPQVMDSDVLRLAREIEKKYRASWWDSLIVAAAQKQHCSVLLTEDMQDGMRFGTVRVQNPFRLGVSEPVAEYETGPATAVSRHPRRGRPKRASRPVRA